jgi:hypothetical protein
MNEKKVVNEKQADIWRRQINQFSVGMLIALLGLFAFEILSQRTNEFYAETRIDETQNLMVVDDDASDLPIMHNSQANPPQSASVDTAEDTQGTLSTESPATNTTTVALPTNTAQPADTTVPTTTTVSESTVASQTPAAPTSTKVSESAMSNQTYYVILSANLRPCPYVTNDCAVTESLSKGTSVTVTGEVEGDNFRGSTLWYSIERNGHPAFVHSALVSTTQPTP